MTQRDLKDQKSLREWTYDHCIALMFLGLLIIFGTLFALSWDKFTNGFIEYQQEAVENNKMVMERNVLLRVSNDCTVLQNAILNSLSRGNNVDAWFPTDSEQDLKIGQKRYEVLGCNK